MQPKMLFTQGNVNSCGPDAVQPWEPRSAVSATILIVDDEEQIRSLLTEIVTRLGHKPLLAKNGLEALDKLRKGKKADLIVSDIKMPKMDGFELARRISAGDNPVPVLLISGYGDEEHALDELPRGAFFLPKPFKMDALESQIKALLDGEG